MARSRPVSAPWLGVGLLSLAVAGTSFVVPQLLPGQSSTTATTPSPTPASTPATTSATTSAPSTTSAPTTTSPATTSPTATPTPEATTPSSIPSTTKKLKPKPTFEPVTINPWAKTHESSGIEVIDCPLCVSGKRVQYLGQGHYVIVRLKDVKVPGRRTMTIIYTCACDDAPRELDVMLNSDPVRTLALKGARSWDSPARTTVKVNLVKGENVIRFFNQEAPAPDLDQILIR
ncbi:hypothetical protein Kisp01_53890 [Kineosporia sp. NBRC 101677]|uniref:hypothetical protein n=1 Tax=Kineosporia sp. NBRC 101677 TaxID=3032197 RepID=UPI0024A188C5|nr:hypothetical protein [Kineosporia sp. NBRC 101677]GLY18375.1 hypothetical protein Kisp01_53890 [Kineosporia sp. NBRC 101677]